MSISRLFCASLFAAASVVSCGGSSSDVPTPGPSPVPAPAPAPTSTQATANIGAGGGQVELTGVAKVSIPAGALASDVIVTVATDASEEEADKFSSNVYSIGVSDADPSAVRISVGAQDWSSEALQVTFRLSSEMSQLAAAGRTLAVLAAGTDYSDDPDKGEDHDVYDPIEAVVDTASNTLTATIPSTAFAADGQTVSTLLRVAAYAAEFTNTTAAAKPQAGSVAADNQCPGDASFTAPMIYGWRAGAFGDPKKYYNGNVAGVVGPFAEPRGPAGGHVGMDLFADEGTPVLAVADGYVHTVWDENWLCPDKKHPALRERLRGDKTPLKKYPEYRLILAVTNSSGKVTDYVTYRHLTKNSVSIDGLKEDTFNRCWQDDGSQKYKVEAGDQIALTGSTGTLGSDRVPPHLHIEWVPVPNTGNGVPRNPICKLGTVFAGKIGMPDQHDRAELSPFLRGWAAPGTYYSAPGPVPVPVPMVEFLVRRNKPQGAVNTCQASGGPSPCDVAGRGHFDWAFSQVAPTHQWPEDSRGELGKQEFKSNESRVYMSMEPRPALPPSFVDPLHQTPPPSVPILESRFNFDFKPPCNVNASFTYKISVPWDRHRKERRYFGLFDSGTFTTRPTNSPDFCDAAFK